MDFNSAFLSPTNLVSCTKIGSVCKSSTNSPKIVFEVNHFSVEAKKGSSNVFIHSSDTMRNVQLTRNDLGFKSSDPVLISDFLPIGTVEDQLFYLKDGNIWGMLLSGGESFLVCKQPVPIESFKVFQGEENRIFLLLVMEVYPSLSPAATAQQDSQQAASGTSGVVFNKLMVRHWDKWGAHSKRNHLFICPLDICEHGLLRTSHVKQVSKSDAISDDMVDLMFGMETDCPGKGPGLGGEEYSVSSDGQHIAFACRRTVDGTLQHADMAWNTDIGIYLVTVSDYINEKMVRSLPTLISGEEWRGSNSCPTFSPDCRKLAFLSGERAGYESDRAQIRIFDVASSELYSLTASIDLSFASIEWDIPHDENSTSTGPHTEPREYTVYATAPYRASVRIFRLHFSGYVDSLHFMEVMDGDESRSSPLVLPLPPAFRDNAHFYGGRATSLLYYLENTLLSPVELKRAVLAPQDAALFIPFVSVPLVAGSPALRTNPSAYVQEIYSPNPQYTNGDLILPECTQHYFKNSEGELVQCWYMHPVVRQQTASDSQVVTAEGSAVDQEDDTRPVWCSGGESEFMPISDLKNSSVPLLVVIHGGPQSSMLNHWNYRWNLATLASQGYGVLAVNFHGSTGFGTPFCDSIRNDWGGKPFDDIMRGTDFILEKFSYLDASRTAALGPSYGGYMINWINGHTDRFKCLVNHDGIFSLRSQYFSNEELWFPEWEFGLPWERPEEYLKWSPDTYVAEWKTPTLVIHGGRDYRVCETEGIATFTALQRRGVPSQMLYFPDENHWTLKPINSLKWHSTVFEWLHRWLQVDISSSSSLVDEEDKEEEIEE